MKHINLFDLVIDHLKDRKLLERVPECEKEKGDEALGESLRSPLKSEKLSQLLAEVAQPEEQDLVLISGVGSVWPLFGPTPC